MSQIQCPHCSSYKTCSMKQSQFMGVVTVWFLLWWTLIVPLVVTIKYLGIPSNRYVCATCNYEWDL
jgi:transposase-like protein